MAPDTAPPSVPAWHTLGCDAVSARAGSDQLRGLSEADAAARLARDGRNVIREGPPRSKLGMLFAQFKDFMILLLIAAAIVSGLIGDIEDTIVILAIVVLNAAVGLRTGIPGTAGHRRAEAHGPAHGPGGSRRPPAAFVRGGAGTWRRRAAGGWQRCPGRPSPARNSRSQDRGGIAHRQVVAGKKHAEPSNEPDLPLADRTNMAFKGTLVLYGRGRGMVVATAMQTELGHIASMLEGAGLTRTPLQRRLTVFGRQIGIAALSICALIFAIGLMRGEPPLLMLLTALSLAVAALPEAMPAVVTVLLALGAARMAREHALIRRLPAVETLGSVTTICSDKTGTLTRNEMRAVEAFVAPGRIAVPRLDPEREPDGTLLRALALCNDVASVGNDQLLGEPTEVALWQAAAEAGINKAEYEQRAVRVMELPFELGPEVDDDIPSGRFQVCCLHQRRTGERDRTLRHNGDRDRRGAA